MVSATRCHEIQRTVYIQCSALHVVKEFWETVHMQFWALLYTKKNIDISPYAMLSPTLSYKEKKTVHMYW